MKIRRTVKWLFVVLTLALLVPILPQSGSQATVIVAEQQGRKIQPLRGEAVRLLVSELRTRNKGFDRAMRDMERMGKRPLWDASAAIPLPAKRRQVATFRPASYTEPQDMISDGNGGEMIFVTYGGPDSYWDGTVYVHDNYQEATYNAVVEDFESPDTSVWDVVDELYYPPDGGDPEREYPCGGSYPCLQTRATPRPNRQGVDMVDVSSASRARATAPFGGGWFRRWWGCTRTGCQQGALQCGGAGSFRPFFICTAVRCTASAIACI